MAEPYNFIEQYKRSVDFGNAISDNIRGNNSGKYKLHSDGMVYAYPRGYKDGEIFPSFMYRFPEMRLAFLSKNKPLGSTSRGELINTIRSVTDIDNPYTLNAALSAYGYGTLPVPITVSPVQYPEKVNASDVIKLKQEADRKEEADLVDRWRKKTIADLDITNPLGKTALDTAFYEGPLDWYKRKGFTNTSIKDLQTKLRSAGYNVGNIDGIMGTKTLNAIKLFQKDNNLTVDGLFGNNTKRILESKLAQTTPTRLDSSISPIGYDATVSGGNDINKRAMLRTPSVKIRTEFGNNYVPSTYTEEGTGNVYKFTPLAKTGGQLNYQKIFK